MAAFRCVPRRVVSLRSALLAPLVGWAVLLVPTELRGQDADPLARARALYNQGQLQASLDATDLALRAPQRVDQADLIAARVLLERYSVSSQVADLEEARVRLRRLVPVKFTPLERAEYLVGLGQMMFIDRAWGAAAHLFESVLDGDSTLPSQARERVLDWWATATERDARGRSGIERQSIFQRMRERMGVEAAARPDNVAAAYWAASAARSQGDAQGAWDAVLASWVRSPLMGDRAARLRTDLDDLMTRAVALERARQLGRPQDLVLEEWSRFKDAWSGLSRVPVATTSDINRQRH